MSTKQLLAEINRGINALQKARVLCLKSEAAAPKAKTTAAKTAKVTKVPAKKATRGSMSEEGRAKIAAAQQKRWAKVRRAKNKAAKAARAALAVPAAE
jgi:Fic family protein